MLAYYRKTYKKPLSSIARDLSRSSFLFLLSTTVGMVWVVFWVFPNQGLPLGAILACAAPVLASIFAVSLESRGPSERRHPGDYVIIVLILVMSAGAVLSEPKGGASPWMLILIGTAAL